MTNEALLSQSAKLQERLGRFEDEAEISSRIIQVSTKCKPMPCGKHGHFWKRIFDAMESF